MLRFKLIYFMLYFSMWTLACTKAKENHSQLQTAPYIDITRLGGDWYIPARIPTFFDRDAIDMKINIRPTASGSMNMVWLFKRGSTSAEDTSWNLTSTLENETNTTSWVLSPIWPLKFNYKVIDYSGDYSWLVLGSTDRRYLWILSREQQMAPELLAGLIDRLKMSQFDVAAILSQTTNSKN